MSLLRGINVGGHHKIPMAPLRALYESIGFEDVTTYIQSGNVVFRAAPGEADRSTAVEAAIAGTFGWAIRVTERSHEDLVRIQEADPFPGADPTKRLVMFLCEPLADAVAAEFGHVLAGGDEAVLVGREIHLYCPDGFGRTGLTKILTDRRLGVATTTRNRRTVGTLTELTA